MKYLGAIVIFFISYTSVLAGGSINIEVNKENVEVGETFSITVTAQTDDEGDIGGVAFAGLSGFQLFSTSKGESIEQINDSFQRVIKMKYDVSASNAWEYHIGPAEITFPSGRVESETVLVTVWENVNSGNLTDSLTNDSELEFRDELREPKKKVHIIIPLLVLFAAIFYYVVSSYFSRNKQADIVQEDESKVVLSSADTKKRLQKVLKIKITEPKHLFYGAVNTILREYFEGQWIREADTLTYTEIEELHILSDSLLQAFHASYLQEFSKESDSEDIRKEIIHKLIQAL